MSAIVALSTLSVHRFHGGRYLTSPGTSGLAATANTMIAKINELITAVNAGTVDYLAVGSGSGAYYGSGVSWLIVDGTHYPTLPGFRIQDQANGAWITVTYNSGAGGFQYA